MGAAVAGEGPEHDAGLEDDAFEQGAEEGHFGGGAFDVVVVGEAGVVVEVGQAIGVAGAEGEEFDHGEEEFVPAAGEAEVR